MNLLHSRFVAVLLVLAATAAASLRCGGDLSVHRSSTPNDGGRISFRLDSGPSAGGAGGAGGSEEGGGPGGGDEPVGPAPLYSDAGRFATEVTTRSVLCTTAACDTTNQMCCGNPAPDAGNGCVSSTTACTAVLALACDGPEDCGASEACCFSPRPGGLSTTCTRTCGSPPDAGTPEPQFVTCHSYRQCPGSRPYCCGPTGFFFKFCRAPDEVSNGDECDIP